MTEPGDICDNCALIGVPGALCPRHAALDELIAASLQAIGKLEIALTIRKRLTGIGDGGNAPTLERLKKAVEKAK